MAFLLCILNLILVANVSGYVGSGPALIIPQKEYTLIYEKPNFRSSVKDTIFKEDFIYYELIEDSSFAKVYIWKGKEVIGDDDRQPEPGPTADG